MVLDVSVQDCEFPESSDDVCLVLKSLSEKEATPTQIVRNLALAALRVRVDRNLRSRETTEGDNVVASMEEITQTFLGVYQGQDFATIYPWLREWVEVMPKLKTFGLDICDIRDVAEDYDEGHNEEDDPFRQIAEGIRQMIHRRLSPEAISVIDALETHIETGMAAIIDCRFCSSTPAARDCEKQWQGYQELLRVRDQLKTVWNQTVDRKNVMGGTAGHQEDESFFEEACKTMEDLTSPYQEEITKSPEGRVFWGLWEEVVEAFKEGRLEDTPLGLTRYRLVKLIERESKQPHNDKGARVLRLLTLDTFLENLTVCHYANVVNADLHEINDDNYAKAIEALVELALCARATGQATKTLGRDSFQLRRLLESGDIRNKAHQVQGLVQSMIDELSFYIDQLKLETADLLSQSEWYKRQEHHDRVMNGIIREKSTHLLSILLSKLLLYLGQRDQEVVAQVGRAIDREKEAGADKFRLETALFRFGPDWTESPQAAVHSWRMGGKGASLAEVSRMIQEGQLLEIDVPKGFGFSPRTWPNIVGREDSQAELRSMLHQEVGLLEQRTGKFFGRPDNPLLLAARSGAIVSMPGMLTTIAHIGLNLSVVEEWAKTLPEPARAYHAYIRFLLNYATSVAGLPKAVLFKELKAERASALYHRDIDRLKGTIAKIHEVVRTQGGQNISEDPYDQLWQSVKGVFDSYHRSDAQRWVEQQHIPSQYESGCLVQDCLPVLSDCDCSGVMLTRDPRTGGKGTIEFVHQFGEDLVGGTMTPQGRGEFKEKYPKQYKILLQVAQAMEKRYNNPNDIEFGIRDGKVIILQTRRLALTPVASVVVYFCFFEKGLIDQRDLLERTSRHLKRTLLRSYLDSNDKQNNEPIAIGQPVSGGAATGRLVFSESGLAQHAGETVIFLTKSNIPRDVTKHPQVGGYISEEGGVTSHAAIISIGRLPCVVNILWEENGGVVKMGGRELREGDLVTIDANDGCIYQGGMEVLISPEIESGFIEAREKIMGMIRS